MRTVHVAGGKSGECCPPPGLARTRTRELNTDPADSETKETALAMARWWRHSSVTQVALVLVVLQWTTCSAHVALTYPAARKFDLDFLDNSRTKGPCGMPK
ncbi:hypothetical protein B566_EDAN012449, partial [Ephemera danica]